MKKIIMLLLSITLILTLTGCTKKASPDETQENEITTSTALISEYFPSEKGLVLEYSGGFEDGGETYTVEQTNGDKVQLRIANTGVASANVFTISSNEIRLTNMSVESAEGIDLTSEASTEDYLVLKGPITVGTTWTVNNDVVKTITAVDKELTVEAGTFLAIEVTTIYDEVNETKSISYFAKELGLIKDTYYTGEDSFGSELKNIIHPE